MINEIQKSKPHFFVQKNGAYFLIFLENKNTYVVYLLLNRDKKSFLMSKAVFF